MKIERQVCSLEQAKKLKSFIGCPTVNHYWVELDEPYLATKKNVDDNLAFDNSLGDNMVAVGRLSKAWESIHPAYSVAELGVMLLDKCNCITNKGAVNHWKISFEHANVNAHERNLGTGTTKYSITCMSESDARASLLIYLLENKLTTTEEVNNRII